MGKKYAFYFEHLVKSRSLPFEDLKSKQVSEYENFVKFAIENSAFYKMKYAHIDAPWKLDNIKNLPILDKETLRQNIDDIRTIPQEEAVISKTGGTTGVSLKVYFTKDDTQKRFGMLDAFRNDFGYTLGKKTAWFSGKAILGKKDIARNRFWKMDYIHKVRYYSTFHIQRKNATAYIENLIKFRPEYIVGFPSCLLDIANYGLEHDIAFPADCVKAIFPTAEQVDINTKNVLERFFKTSVYDQYASSEGAPFIIECKNRKLHLEMQSGVFEVLDADNNEAKQGRLIMTSFTTHGTPLIRYDIGDELLLSDETCNCGNENPLVAQILGRTNDFIFSKEIGKINLGNISNALKDVTGVRQFQVVQDSLDAIKIKIVIDEVKFLERDRVQFIRNIRDRVGDKMHIDLEEVSEIARESSGKFRILKNNIKHLIS
jgi:phenylacetate-CoA ligase